MPRLDHLLPRAKRKASDLGSVYRILDLLLDESRLDDALSLATEALRRAPQDLGLMRRALRANTGLGEYSAALEVIRRMRTVSERDEFRVRERMLVGALRELEPDWLPEVPGDTFALGPASDVRVLHILKESLPHAVAGYTVRGHEVMRAQVSAGFEPVGVTSYGFPEADPGAPPADELDGIRYLRVRGAPERTRETLPHDRYLSEFAREAAEVVRAVRPALIHAHSGYRGYDNALVGIALARAFRLPLIYEVRGFLEATWTSDLAREEASEVFRLRHRQETRCMREADHVVTIAESMRDEIVARGIDPAKVSVVPNAVEPSRFTPRPRDESLARALGIGDRVVIGYVSNLGYREGVDLLVEATARLRASGVDVACLVVGDGPERGKLETMVTEGGLGEAVKIVGSVPHDHVAAYYSLIDVFVIPRRDDRAARLVTPLKPYEAMALGKPLLVSALPALLEIAAPEERGLSFRPGDVPSLVEQAARMVGDAELRTRLAARAREWVIRERTWASNAERYRSVLERVLSDRAGSAA